MPEPFKNLFSPEFVTRLGQAAAGVDPGFDPDVFRRRVLDRDWEARELKDRMRHISTNLYQGLRGTYPQRMETLIRVGPCFSGLPALVFPDVVEVYGLDQWSASMKALEAFTPLCSSEFAVRPFIVKDSPRMMKQMMKWAKSPDEHVRRLASEGCRPRLPWAMALPEFKKDPSPVLPVLEALRTDASEYVRRSVANNLNDISKDHPDLVLRIARRWLKEEPERRKLLKHACRTLLKKGDQRALKLFGLAGADGIAVSSLRVKRKRVRIGDAVDVSFDIDLAGAKPRMLRIEYAIEYRRKNGAYGRKVFKISERKAAGKVGIQRRHSMRDMTTRTHHPGTHYLAVIVNGREMARTSFELSR